MRYWIALALYFLCHWTIAVATPGDIRIDGQVVSTENRRMLDGYDFKAAMLNIFEQQKQLVYTILESLKIDPDNLPQNVRQKINQIHTRNMRAFMAFSRGLDLLDQNKFREAKLAFRYARTLDPNFSTALRFERSVPKNFQSYQQLRQVVLKRGQQQASLLLQGTHQNLNRQAGNNHTQNPVIFNHTNTNDNSEGTHDVIDDIISETDTVIDFMIAVQAQPEEAQDLMQQAMQDLSPQQALESMLVALDNPSIETLNGLLKNAFDNGLTLAEAQALVDQFRATGICQ